MNHKTKKIQALLPLVLLAATTFVFFFVQNPYILFTKEQTTLFAFNWDFLASFFARPAFVAEWAGGFLTQFYYYTGGGAVVLCIVLILFYLGLKKAFSCLALPRPELWALVPCFVEAVLAVRLEYPLSMSIAAAVAPMCFVLRSRILPTRIRFFADILFAIVLYVLIGAHSYIYICLALIDMLKSKSWLNALIITALSVAIPFLTGLFYALTPLQALCYPIEPGYLWQRVYLFLLTELSLMGITLIALLPSSIPAYILPLLAAVGMFFTSNREMEYILAISSEAYFGRWEKVDSLSTKNKDIKSSIAAYYANLSQSVKGSLGDDLFSRYQSSYKGLMLGVTGSAGYLRVMMSIDALMQCEDYAQAQHSALVAISAMPRQRSSRVARRLAEISIAIKEMAPAEKMIDLLEDSFPHRKWAKRQRRIMEEARALADATEDTAGADKSLAVGKDILFAVNDWPGSLRNILETNADSPALDYLLCFHLLNKDNDSFKEDYDKYYYSRDSLRVPPKTYQQALIMCLSDDDNPYAQFSKYHINKSIYDNCVEYSKAFAQNNYPVDLLEQKFGDTYWLYFNFAQLK